GARHPQNTARRWGTQQRRAGLQGRLPVEAGPERRAESAYPLGEDTLGLQRHLRFARSGGRGHHGTLKPDPPLLTLDRTPQPPAAATSRHQKTKQAPRKPRGRSPRSHLGGSIRTLPKQPASSQGNDGPLNVSSYFVRIGTSRRSTERSGGRSGVGSPSTP